MSKYRVICVDFDGTIADHVYPDIGYPVPAAFNWLKRFQEMGFKLILWTMRSGKELSEAVEFCKSHGIQFYGVNANPDQSSWTNSPKAYGQCYIDDNAVGCPLSENPRLGGRPFVNWDLVGPMVLKHLGVA